MLTTERADEYLTEVREREIARHRSGQFDALGGEYDPVLVATLPLEERARKRNRAESPAPEES